MTRSTQSRTRFSAVDGLILSYAQLVEPTNAAEVNEFAEETELREAMTVEELAKRFNTLARNGYLWRTADEKFVVTPKGNRLARLSLDSEKRDKLRLLILNERRKKRGGVHG